MNFITLETPESIMSAMAIVIAIESFAAKPRHYFSFFPIIPYKRLGAK